MHHIMQLCHDAVHTLYIQITVSSTHTCIHIHTVYITHNATRVRQRRERGRGSCGRHTHSHTMTTAAAAAKGGGGGKAKAYELILNGMFKEALQALEGENDAELERSYALYRVGSLSASLEVSARLLRRAYGDDSDDGKTGAAQEGDMDIEDSGKSAGDDSDGVDLRAIGKLLKQRGAARAPQRQSLLAALQVRAQVLVKLGRHASSARHLETLIDASASHARDVDVVTNFVAALAGSADAAQCRRGAELVREWVERESAGGGGGGGQASSYELIFNGACASIGEMAATMETGSAAAVTEQLTTARQAAEEQLEEQGCSREEILDELIELDVQEAYLASLTGDRNRATDMYLDLVARKPSTANASASVAIAANNLAAVRGEKKELGDTRRKIERLTDDKAMALMTRNECRAISFNRIILLLHANKLGAATTAIANFERSNPDSASLTARLRSTLMIRSGKADEAVTMLKDVVDRQASDATDDAMLLMLAQVAGIAGKLDVVIETLRKLADEELRYSPTVVATLSQAFAKSGDEDGAMSELEAAALWWSSSMREDEEAEKSLWAVTFAAAEECFRCARYESAVKFYGMLKDRANGGAVPSEFEDQRGSVLLGFVRCLSKLDPEEAKSFAEELPDLPGAADIDADNLERTFRGGIVHARENIGSKERIEAEAEAAAISSDASKPKKKRRKRKIRYPKDFDPENPGPPPDPERWLPKKERSTFKKKGQRRKDREFMKGAQGATLTKEEREAEESPMNAAKATEALMKGKGKRRSGKK